MKLLITDDQKSVHMFFDRMLHYEELGITQVFHAGNGKEALEIIKKEWPELMILDIRMPVMDGLSLIKAIHDFSFEYRIMMFVLLGLSFILAIFRADPWMIAVVFGLFIFQYIIGVAVFKRLEKRM